MESFRRQISPGSERFLGHFAPPPSDNGSAGVELDEDEVFWTGSDHSEPNLSFNPTAAMAIPNPSPALSRFGFRRPHSRNSGILAALPEDDKKWSSLTAADPFRHPNSNPSPARMIPAIPKPTPAYGAIYHQSAPVNIPVGPARSRKVFDELDDEGVGGEEDEMLPPHEMVAKASAKESPMTASSVLEGVGRTLKGRDLRRVRNAVWRQTGFLD